MISSICNADKGCGSFSNADEGSVEACLLQEAKRINPARMSLKFFFICVFFDGFNYHILCHLNIHPLL
jgi:hypothetical protein